MAGESLREQLAAAFEAQGGADNVDVEAGAAAPAVDTGGEVAAEVAAQAGQDGQEAAAEGAEGGQPRGPDGKFAPKSATAQPADAAQPAENAQKAETIKPEGQEPDPNGQAIRAPQSLPAAVKAKFASLDPDVQQAFVGIEDSVQKAKAEWGKKAERLNRYDEIVGPHADRWRLNGLDEFSGVQSLIAAQNILERNPVEGLVYIARSYGVHPQQLVQQLTGQPMGAPQAPTPQGFDPAALAPVLQQYLTPLQERLEQLQSQTEAEKLGAAQKTVDEFASRPENLYWNDVRQDVAFLLRSERANSLEEAYEMACWASPTIRPLLITAQGQDQQKAAQEAAQRKQAEAAARTKSQNAQKAAGSVTGAPAGAAAAPQQSSTGNLRSDLEAAWTAAQGV